ncbi:MAG TPA: EamA/RhaT family transporter [Opitutaceae bacterium]|nr:EamA/RhaT family transporter [Opitutaceae bacterium]
MSPALLLPLIAAAIYAGATMLIKRAADLGAGLWRVAFVVNITGALLFQSLHFLGGKVHPALWWQPVIVGACFAVGQWLTMLSIDQGDVSVATPVLGLKILLVAALVTAVNGTRLPGALWVAASLATFAIVLLNHRGPHATHPHVGRTILAAGAAAGCFAIFDVLVQRWSPLWGIGRFLPLTLAVSGTLSLGFIPFFRAPLSALPAPTWRWLLIGAVTLGMQTILFVAALAQWGNAPAANVLYSSRGLWSVAFVWLFGHWVKSREQRLEASVLRSRLAGAALMTAAIALVLT